MYTSAAHRAAEIESGALVEPGLLRTLVNESAAALAVELAELTSTQRAATVVTAQGRSIPADQIAWLRCREVGVHAVDLGAGVTFADLPDEFLDVLVHEVVTRRAAAGQLPEVAAWLTGRSAGTIGAWL
jgi:maleylpyruvate isomerase